MSGARDFGFEPRTQLRGRLGRTGLIRTPHGTIATPAFVAVGTKATVKAVLPESMAQLGAQAVLANAYHLYLQPGADIVEAAGGLSAFMNWPGPTFTDSGGFQVMSLGVGFKKVLAMDVAGLADDDVVADGKNRLAHVDDDGVTFTSHLDGSKHRFTPEISMRIQHQLGADVIFAFDELTTLMNTRGYQEQSVARTHAWAARCLAEHRRLTDERPDRPYQALFGVVQGAHYEDLRRRASRELAALDADGHGFDGYGIGGALEKVNLGAITGWVAAELPEDRPRHMLGISEPGDLFTCIENGADTFDCVSPSRVARNAARLHPRRTVQRHHRRVPPRVRSGRPRMRLLHLHALHARLSAPSLQGEGDARRDLVHDPQRALHRAAGRHDPGCDRPGAFRGPTRGVLRSLLRGCAVSRVEETAPGPLRAPSRQRAPGG